MARPLKAAAVRIDISKFALSLFFVTRDLGLVNALTRRSKHSKSKSNGLIVYIAWQTLWDDF